MPTTPVPPSQQHSDSHSNSNSRQTWLVRTLVQDYLILRHRDLTEEETRSVVPAIHLVAHLHDWLGSAFSRRLLHEMYANVSGFQMDGLRLRETTTRDQIHQGLSSAFQDRLLVGLRHGPLRMKSAKVTSSSATTAPMSSLRPDRPSTPLAQPLVSKVLSAYFAIKQESKPPKGKKTPVNVSFEKISTSVIGATVCIVVDTMGLKGKKITVQILGGKTAVLVPVNQQLPVLVDGCESTSLTADVGNWTSMADYGNAATLKDKAIIEFRFERDSKEKTTDWRIEIANQTPKKSYFYLKVTAEGGGKTESACEDEKSAPPSREADTFYNKDNTYFQLSGCYCDKDLEAWEIKEIYKKEKLFTKKNCPLPEKQKTFEEFTKALNKAMNAYLLTSCLRKAHFLSQVSAETGLDTTVEYADGWDYDPSTHKAAHDNYELYLKNKNKKHNLYLKYNTPQNSQAYRRYIECINNGNTLKGDGPKYKGRGLIQITWKKTYKSYLGTEDNPEIIANSIEKACDSAAWYWTQGCAWGNLNQYADNDDFIYVSIGINGGMNGFDERKKSLKSILRWMRLEDICISKSVAGKVIGEYKYSTSAMRNKAWGRKHKSSIEDHDD